MPPFKRKTRNIRAGLRGFYSTDIDDLETYRPDDPECFEVGITAFVGPADGRGEEMFSFSVCTARWLLAYPPEKNFAFLRHTILVSRWDYPTLERALADLCLHTEGADWSEVATKLSRYGYWEFEDSRE